MEQRQRILYLLDRFTTGHCTDNELKELFTYIGSNQYNDIQCEHIGRNLYDPAIPGNNLEACRSQLIFHKILTACQ